MLPQSINGLSSRTRTVLDGVGVDRMTMDQVVAHIMRSLDDGTGGILVTPNTDILRQLRRPHMGDVVEHADLLVPDGMPLVWAARMAGQPLPERVTGADMVWQLSAAASRERRSVFLFGAAPGVAQDAADSFRQHYGGLDIVGVASPPVGFDDDPVQLEASIAEVAQAKPDLVFVALGFPRQERWAIRMRTHLPGTWFIGCGGALDMAAGRIPRAHPLAQQLGAEWVHRLSMEPTRLARRYLVHDAPYAAGLLARSALRRFSSRSR